MTQPLVLGPTQHIEPPFPQGRCATCRWARLAPAEEVGEGGLPMQCALIGIIRQTDRDYSRWMEIDTILAGAETDGSEAELWVSPSFGCVMHESKLDQK